MSIKDHLKQGTYQVQVWWAQECQWRVSTTATSCMIFSQKCLGEQNQFLIWTIGFRCFNIFIIVVCGIKRALFKTYAVRRYGKENPFIAQALRLLSNSVYNANATVRNFHGHVLILRPPALGLKVNFIINSESIKDNLYSSIYFIYHQLIAK